MHLVRKPSILSLLYLMTLVGLTCSIPVPGPAVTAWAVVFALLPSGLSLIIRDLLRVAAVLLAVGPLAALALAVLHWYGKFDWPLAPLQGIVAPLFALGEILRRLPIPDAVLPHMRFGLLGSVTFVIVYYMATAKLFDMTCYKSTSTSITNDE